MVTLTKHRGLSKPEDEQLHTLPMYVLDDTDEWGSREGIVNRVHSGALEVVFHALLRIVRFVCAVSDVTRVSYVDVAVCVYLGLSST